MSITPNLCCDETEPRSIHSPDNTIWTFKEKACPPRHHPPPPAPGSSLVGPAPELGAGLLHQRTEPAWEVSQFSCSVVSDSLRPNGLQHDRLPCPSPTPGACSDSTNGDCDAIQPSHPLLSSSLAFSLAQDQGLFQRVSSSCQVAKVLGVSASASILPMIFRTDFP